ncbi:MAG: hypothetical protein RML72_06175 [Bacteroidia bacterium]|nr:hypothetical protein [Bacteroidia bacterium]MDW8158446.1 hypothetical protein [Bacteroidia bacterium]
MNKYKLSSFILRLGFLCIGCSDDYDPEGKVFWYFVGLPFIGICYGIGAVILSLFTKRKQNSYEEDMPAIPAVIIGFIVIMILYFLYKNYIN